MIGAAVAAGYLQMDLSTTNPDAELQLYEGTNHSFMTGKPDAHSGRNGHYAPIDTVLGRGIEVSP